MKENCQLDTYLRRHRGKNYNHLNIQCARTKQPSNVLFLHNIPNNIGKMKVFVHFQ